MKSIRRRDTETGRWVMLAVVSLGVVALTLNWFDIATVFPSIGAAFTVGLGPLSYLVSLFVVGYGLAHIPSGMLSTSIGLKRTLVLGLSVQGVAGITSGLAQSYTELAVSRVVSGIGGSMFATVGFAAVTVWFHEKDLTFALGIFGGVAFSTGVVLALYVWVYVQRAAGWRTSLALGGAFELLAALVTVLVVGVPDRGGRLDRLRFDRTALGVALSSRQLWIYGLALAGGYGAYLTASQLFSEYATLDRHLAPSTGGVLSALIALGGIPGSAVGGYFADRSTNLRLFVLGPLGAVAVLLATIPVVPTDGLWVDATGIGFFLLFGFAAWSAVPARVCHIDPRHLGTASGLMLSLAALGGFFVPIVFGYLVPRTSFDTGWVFLAVVAFLFALVGLAGRNPGAVATRTG